MTSIISQLKRLYKADQIVARDTTSALSCTDIISQCSQISAILAEKNIHNLVLHSDNSLGWLIIDLTCQNTGISLLPLPTFFSITQLKHALQNTPFDAIITDNSVLPGLLDNISNLKYQSILDDLLLITLDNHNNSYKLPEKTGKITYTSGSTGTPNGVCLDNNQLLKQAQGLADIVGLSNPRHLCLLPLSTLLENVAGVYAPILSSGEVIVPSLEEIGFTGSSSLIGKKMTALISQFQPSSMILTPQILMLLLTAVGAGWTPPTTLKFVAVGGSRVSPDFLEKSWKAGIPVYEGYGLSECASVVSLNTPAKHLTGSCGKLLPHLDVRIEAGEVVVAGNPMLGYVNDPESWAKKQIYTGDLGSLDDAGFLHIHGRSKNLLISSFGRNISPEWVESEFLSHPEFLDFVVFGDAQPFCVALLSVQSPQITDDQLQLIIDRTNQNLPDYARIYQWYRLPRPLRSEQQFITDNGKPKRAAIFYHYAPQIQRLYNAESIPAHL
jgi:long-chain acyl-CoA synthetase